MCTRLPATIEAAKEKFALACQEATTLEIVGNVAAAFNAVGVVTLLREALTEEVMDKVFMPLMNTKIGFMTDRTGKPDKRGNVKPLYSRDVVRDCIIDAGYYWFASNGQPIQHPRRKNVPDKGRLYRPS